MWAETLSTASAAGRRPSTGQMTRPGPRKRVPGPPCTTIGWSRPRAARPIASVARPTSPGSSSPKKRSVTCHWSGPDQRKPSIAGRGRAAKASTTSALGHTATKQRMPTITLGAPENRGELDARSPREQAGGDPLNRGDRAHDSPSMPARPFRVTSPFWRRFWPGRPSAHGPSRR